MNNISCKISSSSSLREFPSPKYATNKLLESGTDYGWVEARLEYNGNKENLNYDERKTIEYFMEDVAHYFFNSVIYAGMPDFYAIGGNSKASLKNKIRTYKGFFPYKGTIRGSGKFLEKEISVDDKYSRFVGVAAVTKENFEECTSFGGCGAWVYSPSNLVNDETLNVIRDVISMDNGKLVFCYFETAVKYYCANENTFIQVIWDRNDYESSVIGICNKNSVASTEKIFQRAVGIFEESY